MSDKSDNKKQKTKKKVNSPPLTFKKESESSDRSKLRRTKDENDMVKSLIAQSIENISGEDSSDYELMNLLKISGDKLPSASDLRKISGETKKERKSIFPVESRSSSIKKHGLLSRNDAFQTKQRVIVKNEAFRVNDLLKEESSEDVDFGSALFEDSNDEITRKTDHAIQLKMKKIAKKSIKGSTKSFERKSLMKEDTSSKKTSLVPDKSSIDKTKSRKSLVKESKSAQLPEQKEESKEEAKEEAKRKATEDKISKDVSAIKKSSSGKVVTISKIEEETKPVKEVKSKLSKPEIVKASVIMKVSEAKIPKQKSAEITEPMEKSRSMIHPKTSEKLKTDDKLKYVESAPKVVESVPKATESAPKATESAPKATESAPKATESEEKLKQDLTLKLQKLLARESDLPKAAGSAPKATESAPKATESAPKATESEEKLRQDLTLKLQKLLARESDLPKAAGKSESGIPGVFGMPSFPGIYATPGAPSAPDVFRIAGAPGEPASLVRKKSSKLFVPKSSRRRGLLPKKSSKRKPSQKMSPFSPFFTRKISEVSISSSSVESEDRARPHPSGLSFSNFCFFYRHYRVPDHDVVCCCETKRSLVELQKKSCLDICERDVDRSNVPHPTGLTFSEYKVIMA